MLPLPNLDDRTFEQLVREARDLIPVIFPDWSDENVHDPGITLLEMLAWHIEMQQYRLDRLTGHHERKFLKLLGEAPRDRAPATTSVSFSNASRPLLIPLGTLLWVGDLPFETVRPVTVLPDTKRRVFVHTAEGVQEISDGFESGNAPFYPFGPKAELDSRLIIELGQPLPAKLPLSLWIQLEDQEPDIRIPARYKAFTPSGRVEWSYWDEKDEAWKPLPLERDESYSFHQSGPVLFEITPELGEVRRLMARLAEGAFHEPPLVRRLVWNEVFAKQGQTLCLYETFDGIAANAAEASDGDAGALRLETTHALFLKGEISVQFRREDGGWVDADSSLYTVEREESRAWVVFPDRSMLPKGGKSIRVIAVSDEFADYVYPATGTGISGQSFPIPVQPLLPDELRLQVGWKEEGSEEIVWHDWERVLDFDASGPDSFHYVIDEEEGVIRFSDGVYGAVPPSMPFPNIRIIGYRIGTGAAGNVKEDTIKEMDFLDHSLRVTNLYPAYGGAEAETVREALQRVWLELMEPRCGVTAEDLERRVREIPGLRVARVKAIPGYHPGVRNYPEEQAFGHVSVVVVPYCKQALPMPGEGMLKTIRRHLEPYRLLTTSLHIIPPAYIKVSVRAVIVVDPRYEGREWMVKRALDEWLKPYGDDAGSGWEFGHPVYKSDVYEKIHRVPGVRYIQDVWLMAEGKDVHQEEGGDIRIPPNGLAFSGDHDIEFIISDASGRLGRR
mgnify:CR=1 FL=1